MFEGMMLRFQEDTVRHLFRMQIIGPDGTPIDPDGPLPPWMQSQQPLDLPPAETVSSSNASAPQTITPIKQAPSQTAPVASRPIPTVPTRPASTTIDALEREFHQKKQRELDAARSAGAAAASASNGGHLPRRSGEKIGRNDDCPCGSGKKYKKCHGADA